MWGWGKCTQSLPVGFCNFIDEIPLTYSFRTEDQWKISNSLFLATIIRIGLVVVSYGCKVPAGIFVPSMAIGATFGRMVGIFVKAMYRYVDLYHSSGFSCLSWPAPSRTYPQSGIFKFCTPDVPCITPGTYAFLGAAAALRCVDQITSSWSILIYIQWSHANYCDSCCYHVRVDRRSDIYLANYGEHYLTLTCGHFNLTNISLDRSPCY